MTKLIITIPDDLAPLVLERQHRLGYLTPDAAAEALIREGLVASSEKEDHSAGRTDCELRALIDEAEASGPAETWSAKSMRAEVLRRHAARTGAKT